MKISKSGLIWIIAGTALAIVYCLNIDAIPINIGAPIFIGATIAILAAVYGHEHMEEENETK